MNRELPRPITDDEIRAYDEDGAVCVRGQFERGWIDRMLAVVEANLEDLILGIFRGGRFLR